MIAHDQLWPVEARAKAPAEAAGFSPVSDIAVRPGFGLGRVEAPVEGANFIQPCKINFLRKCGGNQIPHFARDDNSDAGRRAISTSAR
jgi:hypothetical protein